MFSHVHSPYKCEIFPRHVYFPLTTILATLPQVFIPSVVAVHKQTGEIVVGADALRPTVRKTSTVHYPIRPTNKVDKVGRGPGVRVGGVVVDGGFVCGVVNCVGVDLLIVLQFA